MPERIREWWELIIAAITGVSWLSKLQFDVIALKRKKCVEESICAERLKQNELQFASGAAQFAEVKNLIAANDKASQERHSELMRHLLDMNK